MTRILSIGESVAINLLVRHRSASSANFIYFWCFFFPFWDKMPHCSKVLVTCDKTLGLFSSRAVVTHDRTLGRFSTVFEELNQCH